MKQKQLISVLLILALFFIANVLSQYFYARFDLTQDERYTLSEAAMNTIATVESPILIEVYLEGNFPPEFKRLQNETEQLLEEFKAYNSNVVYEFINPLESENPEVLQQQFRSQGMKGAQVQVRENGKVSNEIIYPWAVARYNERSVRIPLLKNTLGATPEERVNNSIQALEYAFANGFKQITNPKNKRIAVLKGNGELDDRYVADLFSTLKNNYYIAPFTLDSVATSPNKTLAQLLGFDLVVVAQPTEAFSDAERYVLDQFIMNGGASLWLMDATQLVQDEETGTMGAIPLDLNLNDFFFKYGLRITPKLVKDVYSAPIVLATGEQRDSEYEQYPWFYHPLSTSDNNHPIVNNIEKVKFEYATAIDTLPNTIRKTILLSSSPITRLQGTPVEINYDKEIPENIKIANEGPNPQVFNAGETPMAVLLEGTFTSVYSNRVKPFSISKGSQENLVDKAISTPTKMVVVSDGDIVKNQLDRGRPLELGFDKWTQQFYGNKEFLLNAVNYLLDDSGLINIRSKKIAVPFLDTQKSITQRSKWQIINLIAPLVFLILFGFVFNFLRKRKYSR